VVGTGEGLGGRLRVGFGCCGSSGWGWRRSLLWLCRVSVLVVMMGVVLLVRCAPVLAVSVGEEWVSDVSSSSATLQACIISGSSETEYIFQYGIQNGASVSYASTVKAVPGGAGSCSGGLSVEAHVQGLLAHTLYDYRVVAATTEGTGQAFTTQPAGGELVLPDGRVWELVSPAVKDGALIPPIESGAGVVQAAEGGGAITYPSNGPLGANPPANSNETQMLSVRLPDGGWSSQDIATPHEIVSGVSVGGGQEYRAFSYDLSLGLVQQLGNAERAVPLSEGASEATPYLRADLPLSAEPGSSEQAAYSEAEIEGGYLPLVTGCPPAGEKCKARVEERANAPPGVKFGGDIRFLGADTDLSHVVFRSREAPLVVGAGEEAMYEWSAGKSPGVQLQLVSVLPDVPPYEGRQAGGAAELGAAGLEVEGGEDVRGAVSSDGSRVVWSYMGHLFMRYSLDGQNWQTVQLDVGGGENGHAIFQFASSDGSKVFFTDEERLTVGSGAEAGKPELYECEMVEEVGGLVCDLSDLTIAKGESADVQGTVLAGGNESSYVYLVAEGVLTSEAEKNAQGERAEAGKDNLYMLHYDGQAKEWKPTFIAVLSREDSQDWAEGGSNLEDMTSRVSPDGEYLVFMSENSLTGYDNIDINSGVSDEEVYLYGAPSTGVPAGRLVCVSCNPTGERPTGVFDTLAAYKGHGLLVDKQKIWNETGGRWLAGSVPGWTAMSIGKARYQSRYVLDSGRVFFDSPDALVPQATNGLVDVYEYEPEGVPVGGSDTCTGSSSTFSAAAGGCIGLISSGSSGEESVFLDASGSGDDVFFLTSAPLVAVDKDTAFDVYDAHACSGLAPCSSEAVSSPACVTVEGCRVSPSLQPSIFGAGASATFSGPGNQVVVSLPVVKKCAKGKKLSRGKCVKVKKGKGKRKRRGKGSAKVRGAGDGRGVAR
jgi:hypothetical protein